MVFAEFALFLLGQPTEIVSIAEIALPVLVCTTDPHVGGGNDAQDLESNACSNAGHVLWPVLGREDDCRDNATQLAN